MQPVVATKPSLTQSTMLLDAKPSKDIWENTVPFAFKRLKQISLKKAMSLNLAERTSQKQRAS